MASLDQQLQDTLAAINGLTEKVESLTMNLNTLQVENRTLRGLQPVPAQTPFIPQPAPLYLMQGVWSNTPAPQSMPRHSLP